MNDNTSPEQPAPMDDERQQSGMARLMAKYKASRERNSRTAKGFYFYDDGTVEAVARRGPVQKFRSPVLDVTYSDGRQRKSVAGRGLAAIATGGLSLAANNNAGYVTVNLITRDWVEMLQSKDDDGQLGKLYGLATQAKARRAEGSDEG